MNKVWFNHLVVTREIRMEKSTVQGYIPASQVEAAGPPSTDCVILPNSLDLSSSLKEE